MLSESDDEIDEDWLHKQHAETIASIPDLRPAEKEFIQRYDRHMLEEGPSSRVHAAEAFIRFVRLNASWLAHPQMIVEFHKKAAALRLQGLLNWPSIVSCTKMIDAARASANGDAHIHDQMDLDEPAIIKEGPILERPRSPQQHIFGRCAVCKEDLHDMRKGIRCAFPGCPQPDYHLQCAGQKSKTSAWLCSPCQESGVTPRDLPARLRPLIPEPMSVRQKSPEPLRESSVDSSSISSVDPAMLLKPPELSKKWGGLDDESGRCATTTWSGSKKHLHTDVREKHHKERPSLPSNLRA